MAARKLEKDQVKVTLAHPLRAEHAVRLGLDEQDYAVEDTVTVRRDQARSLVNAGYAAAVDDADVSEDQDAVEENLRTVDGATGVTSGNKSSSKK